MNEEQLIGNCKALLAKDVVTEQSGYIIAVVGLEKLREPLLKLRIERYKDLCKKREQYRHPKDKDLTDLDRKTMLEAAVADVTADYELVKGLELLIKERVDLIKLLLETK